VTALLAYPWTQTASETVASLEDAVRARTEECHTQRALQEAVMCSFDSALGAASAAVAKQGQRANASAQQRREAERDRLVFHALLAMHSKRTSASRNSFLKRAETPFVGSLDDGSHARLVCIALLLLVLVVRLTAVHGSAGL
jgi:hypothetical protein